MNISQILNLTVIFKFVVTHQTRTNKPMTKKNNHSKVFKLFHDTYKVLTIYYGGILSIILRVILFLIDTG